MSFLNRSCFYWIFISVFLISCSPKTNSALIESFPALSYNEQVTVLEIDDPRPQNITNLGIIKIRDTGFSIKCNYDTVLEKAKLEARKAGGNILHITKHQKPDFWSTCHRIDAVVLRRK